MKSNYFEGFERPHQMPGMIAHRLTDRLLEHYDILVRSYTHIGPISLIPTFIYNCHVDCVSYLSQKRQRDRSHNFFYNSRFTFKEQKVKSDGQPLVAHILGQQR